jgi:Asp-tRNA(Asn)/Glu-tRNA(Gln) amidotransferase A subunit family amidase
MAGKITCKQVAEEYRNEIEKKNFNAFLKIFSEKSPKLAKQIDRK